MKTVYINMRSSYGIETVDEVNTTEFPEPKEFRKEVRNMIVNYSQCGMPVYVSSRCTKDWANR